MFGSRATTTFGRPGQTEDVDFLVGRPDAKIALDVLWPRSRQHEVRPRRRSTISVTGLTRNQCFAAWLTDEARMVG